MTTAEQWVWLARIRRPQGRKGEVLAEILTDFPEKFSERRQLWLLPPGSSGTAPVGAEPRSVELVHHWLHKGSVVLHFAGIDSISAAEALSGIVVAIPRSERAALDDGIYIGDLDGCSLIDVSGAEPSLVGEIDDVDMTAGPVALLVVRGKQGEVLVPLAKSYLRKVDLAGKRIEMALPQGLIDLNAPGNQPG